MPKEILIIDDSWTTLVLLELFLHENGYKTHLIREAKTALDYLSVNTPDLILRNTIFLRHAEMMKK